jgi:Domain of unknown function (DUF6249)
MGNLVPIFGILVPLSAIVLGIGLAFWSIYWGHQKRALQYRERQLMIEKGLAPPPLLLEERTTTRPEDCLRRGIILLSLGLGLAAAAAFLFTFDRGQGLVRVIGVAAAIVGSLGVGNLVYYFIARPKPEDTARAL